MPVRNRIVLGRDRDVAESAALTGTANPFAGCLEEYTAKWSKAIHDLVEIVRYRLGNECAVVAYAYLHRRKWQKTGMKKSTFYKRLKKVKIIFALENTKRNRCRNAAKESPA